MKKKASTQIAEFYRNVVKERGEGNRPKRTFTNPVSKKEEQNYIGVPVSLLEELLREKRK